MGFACFLVKIHPFLSNFWRAKVRTACWFGHFQRLVSWVLSSGAYWKLLHGLAGVRHGLGGARVRIKELVRGGWWGSVAGCGGHAAVVAPWVPIRWTVAVFIVTVGAVRRNRQGWSKLSTVVDWGCFFLRASWFWPGVKGGLCGEESGRKPLLFRPQTRLLLLRNWCSYRLSLFFLPSP